MNHFHSRFPVAHQIDYPESHAKRNVNAKTLNHLLNSKYVKRRNVDTHCHAADLSCVQFKHYRYSIHSQKKPHCLDPLSSLSLFRLCLSSDLVLLVLTLELTLECTLNGAFEEALDGTSDSRLGGSLEGSLLPVSDGPLDVSYTYFVIFDFPLLCGSPGTKSSSPCRGTSS